MDAVKETKQEVKPIQREVLPPGKVKMVNSGIIRIVPQSRVEEFKKKGYTIMA